MDAQPNENFFEITVSQEGSDRIMRMFRTVRMLFAFTIVLSTVFLALGVLRYVFYSRIPTNGNFFIKFESIGLPIYTVLMVVLMIGQYYSFFHFSRLCKKSIQLRQTDLFNYSFKWLTRSAVFSMMLMTVELMLGMFTIYEVSFLIRTMPAS